MSSSHLISDEGNDQQHHFIQIEFVFTNHHPAYAPNNPQKHHSLLFQHDSDSMQVDQKSSTKRSFLKISKILSHNHIYGSNLTQVHTSNMDCKKAIENYPYSREKIDFV